MLKSEITLDVLKIMAMAIPVYTYLIVLFSQSLYLPTTILTKTKSKLNSYRTV